MKSLGDISRELQKGGKRCNAKVLNEALSGYYYLQEHRFQLVGIYAELVLTVAACRRVR